MCDVSDILNMETQYNDKRRLVFRYTLPLLLKARMYNDCTSSNSVWKRNMGLNKNIMNTMQSPQRFIGRKILGAILKDHNTDEFMRYKIKKT